MENLMNKIPDSRFNLIMNFPDQLLNNQITNNIFNNLSCFQFALAKIVHLHLIIQT